MPGIPRSPVRFLPDATSVNTGTPVSPNLLRLVGAGINFAAHRRTARVTTHHVLRRNVSTLLTTAPVGIEETHRWPIRFSALANVVRVIVRYQAAYPKDGVNECQLTVRIRHDSDLAKVAFSYNFPPEHFATAGSAWESDLDLFRPHFSRTPRLPLDFSDVIADVPRDEVYRIEVETNDVRLHSLTLIEFPVAEVSSGGV